jgi:transcriptional regulator with XRE-family HTH domain
VIDHRIGLMATDEPAAVAAAPRSKDFYGALGRAIKVTRTEQGIERKELARLSGLSYPYLSEIEKGKKRASTEALLPIARALGLRQSELLERAEGLLERGLSSSQRSETARRLRAPEPRTLARVYRLQPTGTDSAGDASLKELASRAGRLGADDFNRVLDLVRRLAR